MPQITAIKPQRSGRRVNIYLDGKFGFGLDLENFVKLGLKIEQELTENEISEVIKKAEFQKTYDKILRFGSLRPRSEKEYRLWLKRHKVHESLHNNLFDRLKRLDLLNDKKFALWWVEQRIQFKQKGSLLLKLELRGKGIDKEIIEEILEEVKVDEVRLAKYLIEKKSYKWKNLTDLDVKKKKTEFLLRQGFNWNTINRVISGN
jgi:regulatory protein